MGFTPLEGLVMTTRSGSVDAGIIFWLQRHEGATEKQLNDALDRRSGLLALTGIADMKEVLGGVGEKAAPVRAEAVAGLRFLGLEIADALNMNLVADADVSAPGATVPTLVVRAREDIEVGREVRRVLSAGAPA